MKNTIDIVPEKFRKYVGLRYPIEDQHTKADHMAFSLINECLGAPQTPFGRMSRNGLSLNDETRSFIYGGNYGKLEEPYRRGTRPVLEAWVNRYVDKSMSAGEKAIALSQSLYYDLPKVHPKVPVFLYGEDDQDTLLKGGGHCSCKGRLLVALCQVAGLDARLAFMWAWVDREKDPTKLLAGHTVTEIFVDGHWGFFDPQAHAYVRLPDGSFPSIDDIRRDAGLCGRMTKDEIEKMKAVPYTNLPAGMSWFEFYWYKNFNPKCPTQISRHDVNDPGMPKWFWATDEFRKLQVADNVVHLKILHELADKGELTEKVYKMTLPEFREAFGITNGQMQSQVALAWG